MFPNSFPSPSRVCLARTALVVLLLAPAAARAQAPANEPPADVPVASGQIEVTTTRVPEAVEPEPAEITVVTGEELAARGVRDMAGALAMVAGVTVASGGEAGPAGFVPELWGLREIDAFLIVVDGVPWGGAFNPAVQALDLTDVERIEVLRGAAPVMYGATAFSGVIHVIHHAAGQGDRTASVWGGRFSSGGAAAVLPFGGGSVKQSLAVDGEKTGFADPRAAVRRGHALYRASADAGGGTWRLDADALVQKQDPNSPHPRADDQVFEPLIPLDANFNPTDARMDENRFHLTGGYDHDLLGGAWSTTLAVTRSSRKNTRGFVRASEISDESPDVTADGFRQDVTLTDVYFDTHVAWTTTPALRFILGVDELYGRGTQTSDNFEYEVGLDGEGAPDSHSLHVDESTELNDRRSFAGLYGQVEWQPTPRWNVEAGLRLNHTHETRDGGVTPHDEDAVAKDGGADEGEEVSGSKTLTRASGVLGVNGLIWENGRDGLWAFADYRRSFKPAALDFGPEVEGSEILDPETSRSVELGLKGNLDRIRLHWQATLFDMKLENLLVNVDRNGLPALENGGQQRFRGLDLEAGWRIVESLEWRGSVGLHDTKFENFVDLDEETGEPVQLRGRRPELSPKQLWSTGLEWAPPLGLVAHARVEWVGDRFLDRANTVLAHSYTEWGGGVGWRFPRWELRLDGENLGDTRPPVSESELGTEQFYRLPSRMLTLTAGFRL